MVVGIEGVAAGVDNRGSHVQCRGVGIDVPVEAIQRIVISFDGLSSAQAGDKAGCLRGVGPGDVELRVAFHAHFAAHGRV